MIDTYTVHDCQRCGHLANWHRYDDPDQLVTYDRGEVGWVHRPFACVGPHYGGCPMDCPDFVGDPVTITITEEATP